ncbi:hypothetical protein ACFWAY_48980 [Rhodococcus sp. NPDC059968]|uniref:hypothetical protein n=1 Tax=Rhodococcus sp. NPDC059968 TaxID=3347017 RepID=UPI003671C9D2
MDENDIVAIAFLAQDPLPDPTSVPPVPVYVVPTPGDESWLTQPSATLLAGLAVLASAIIAFLATSLVRRQAERHFRASNRRDRFATIAEQLADTSAAVRVAGVYAMEALIDDWLKHGWNAVLWAAASGSAQSITNDQREAQACINVLCSYLRLPYSPSDRDQHQTKTVVRYAPTIEEEQRNIQYREEHHEYRQEDRPVRQSIVRTIAGHLRDHPSVRSWSALDFDFTGAHFEDADFSGTSCKGRMLYTRAQFHGDRTLFDNAEFHSEESPFDNAKFYSEETSFDKAKFRGARTSFERAQFHGEETRFINTEFRSKETSFDKAEFRSELTSFHETEFHGDRISFNWAEFHGNHTAFDWARFDNKSTAFDHVRFRSSETTSFTMAQFGTTKASKETGVSFDGARFQSKCTSFNLVVFPKKWTSFFHAEFHSPESTFNWASFRSLRTTFAGAQFLGTHTSFADPKSWTAVFFDWEWPLAGGKVGPARTPRPVGIEPDEWPPRIR